MFAKMGGDLKNAVAKFFKTRAFLKGVKERTGDGSVSWREGHSAGARPAQGSADIDQAKATLE
ncbi:HlyD family secretion protein, partial [Enterobacter hormaechei]